MVEVSAQSRALHGLRRDLIATHAQHLNPAQIVGDGLAVVSQHELVGPAPRQMDGCLDVSYAATGPDMDEPPLLFNRPLAAFREPGLVQKCGHVLFGEQMPSQRGELVDPLGFAIFSTSELHSSGSRIHDWWWKATEANPRRALR